MQLHIVNRDHQNYLAGDILAVYPDSQIMTPLVVSSLWQANNPVGLPEKYRSAADTPPGTFPDRTINNFPNEWSAIARFPSYRADLNLAEPWLEIDLTELGAVRQRAHRLWYLDLSALPPGTRNSLEQPGGEAQLGANRLDAIKNRHNSQPITDVLGWELTGQGNIKQRYAGTNARDYLGVG